MKEDAKNSFAYFVGVLVCLVLAACLRWFALWKVWVWFLVPLGLRVPTIAQGFMLLSLATLLSPYVEDKPEQTFTTRFARSVVGSLFFLGLGYTIHFLGG